MTVTSTSVVTMTAKVKRGGKSQPAIKLKQGGEFHHDTGTWQHTAYRVDREANRYDKVVTNPATGEVLYEDHGPLVEHRDRGSARKDRRKTTG